MSENINMIIFHTNESDHSPSKNSHVRRLKQSQKESMDTKIALAYFILYLFSPPQLHLPLPQLVQLKTTSSKVLPLVNHFYHQESTSIIKNFPSHLPYLILSLTRSLPFGFLELFLFSLNLTKHSIQLLIITSARLSLPHPPSHMFFQGI